MAALPYMQLYVADYLADTSHLSTLEHGVYLLLIMNYWQRGGPLPAADDKVARIARISTEEWLTVKDNILPFFTEQNGQLVHLRIERDLEAVLDKCEKAAASGRSSAAKRYGNGRSTNVQRSSNHTDTDTDTEADQIQTAPASPDGDTPASIIPTKRAIPLNRVHDCWLKAIELFGESLTIQDLTPEFERTLSGVLYDKTGGVVKWLAAARALARAPASVKYEKSVTWLLQDQFKALNRVVTWAAQDRGTGGNGNTNYVEAPEKWRKRYDESTPR